MEVLFLSLLYIVPNRLQLIHMNTVKVIYVNGKTSLITTNHSMTTKTRLVLALNLTNTLEVKYVVRSGWVTET